MSPEVASARRYLLALASVGVLAASGAGLLSLAGGDKAGEPGTDPPGKGKSKAHDIVPPPPPPPPDYDFGSGSDPIKWRQKKTVRSKTILEEIECDQSASSVGKIPMHLTQEIHTLGACPKDGCPPSGCSEEVKTACEKYQDEDDDGWVNKDWMPVEFVVMIIEGNSFRIDRNGPAGNHSLVWKKGKGPMRTAKMLIPPKDVCGDLDLLLVRFEGQQGLSYVHKVGIWKPEKATGQD